MLRLMCVPILACALAPMVLAQSQCYACPNPIGSPPTHPVAYGWVWDETECAWVLSCDPYDGCESPIVIDTDGSGFHLTSAADGVKFDFFGTGMPIQIAWTEKGSTNGWLALPKNGQITSALDLFGNLTAQIHTQSNPPNGFAALAIYDLSANGGNNDGVIDAGDAIWPSLRVWIDANHDGIAQAEELHTLGEFGILGITLRYEQTGLTDQYGNQFRFKGHLLRIKSDEVDRKVFDVNLRTQ